MNLMMREHAKNNIITLHNPTLLRITPHYLAFSALPALPSITWHYPALRRITPHYFALPCITPHYPALPRITRITSHYRRHLHQHLRQRRAFTNVPTFWLKEGGVLVFFEFVYSSLASGRQLCRSGVQNTEYIELSNKVQGGEALGGVLYCSRTYIYAKENPIPPL